MLVSLSNNVYGFLCGVSVVLPQLSMMTALSSSPSSTPSIVHVRPLHIIAFGVALKAISVESVRTTFAQQ